MKKKVINRKKGLIKGTPSAVLLSLALHLILLFIAGGLIVFTVNKKKESVFVPPPPVERPKMELIKPRVKIKNPVKPGSLQRIVTKRVQGMPDMQLPAVEGMGEGLGGGLGGFEMIPDPAEMTLFGASKSAAAGNDFEGTFYSLSYDRQGKEISLDPFVVLRDFHKYDWNPFVFSPYYKASTKLYTTHFMIPPFPSQAGPEAFGVDDPNFNYVNWVVHYKGKISSRKDGRFRFWGLGDNVFVIRINKEVVLDASWDSSRGEMAPWKPTSDEDREYLFAHGGASVGHWFELKAEESVVMEVLLQEDGGYGGFILAIEDEDEEYFRNRDGLPVLPAFKTAEFSEPVRARIEYGTIRDEVELNSSLMFNVR